MTPSMLNRLLSPLARRLRLMVGRALVSAISDGGKVQAVQVKLLDGEVRDGVEVLMQYGHASHPPGQPEGLYFAVGGDRDHGVMICLADRQFRLRNLESGESALYDDLGQVVHLTREGIIVRGAGMPVTIRDTPKVRMECSLEVIGDIKDHCDDDFAQTMRDMRNIYNGHDHNENQTVTATPNQRM